MNETTFDGSAGGPTGPFDREFEGGDEDPPKKRLGEFTLIKELGRGGMGIVYEAHDEKLSRTVALKILPERARRSRVAVERFQIEARATARLNHEHIVPVYKVDEERGVPYYAMKLIAGTNLSSVLHRVRSTVKGDAQSKAARSTVVEHRKASTSAKSTRSEFSDASFLKNHQAARSTDTSALEKTVARLGSEVAAALDHAHQNGIIHRDIKPSNLLIDDDHKVWVSDFGLAHLEDQTEITRSGEIIGTYRYMSPEQATGHRSYVDRRTDIYSLGATLYELATLQPICRGRSTEEILRELRLGRSVPIRKVNSRFSRDFEIILCKATERNPTDRYETAAAMAEDLRKVAEGESISTKKVSRQKRALNWLIENPRVASGIMAATLCAILLLSFSLIAAQQLAQRTYESLRTRTSQHMTAEVALTKDQNPGRALAIGLEIPDIEESVQGLKVLMEAADANHEIKTIQLPLEKPGSLAWNPSSDLMLVCAHYQQYDSAKQAWWIDTQKLDVLSPLDDKVTSAAFSKTGNYLLTGASDFGPINPTPFAQAHFETPKLWNTKNRELVREFPDARLATCGPENFSADGQRVVLPCTDGLARSYSLEADGGTLPLNPQRAKPKSAAMGAAFSPDQRFIVTWGDDGHVAVFDAVSGEIRTEFDFYFERQSSFKASFSPDSTWLLTTSDSGTDLRDATDWEKPFLFRASRQSCFVGKAHDVALLEESFVTRLDPATNEIASRVPIRSYSRMLTPVGNQSKVLVQRFKVTYLVDLVEEVVSAEFRGHTQPAAYFSAPAFAGKIASTGSDKTLRFWDQLSNLQQRTVQIKPLMLTPTVIGYSPKGDLAAVGTTLRYDVYSAQEDNDLSEAPAVEGVLRHTLPDGSFLATNKQMLSHYDGLTGRVLGAVKLRDPVLSIESLSENQLVITTDASDVFLWQMGSSVALQVNKVGERMRASVIPGSEKLLVTSGEQLRIMSPRSRDSKVVFSGFQSQVLAVSVSAAANRAAIATKDGLVLIWDLEEQKKEFELESGLAHIELTFASHGRELVLHEGMFGHKLQAWDLDQQLKIAEFKVGRVRNLEVSPDSTFCLFTAEEGALRWDLSENEPQVVLAENVRYACFAGQDFLVAFKPSSENAEFARGNSIIRLLARENGEPLNEHHLPIELGKLHYSAETGVIQASGISFGAQLFDRRTGGKRLVIRGQDQSLVMVDFTNDGKHVVSVSQSGKVLISSVNGKPVATLGTKVKKVLCATLSPNRSVLLVADNVGQLSEWNIAGRKLDNRYEIDEPAQQISFGKQDLVFATRHSSGKIAVWHRGMNSSEPWRQYKFEEGVRSAVLSPDGERLLCILGQPVSQRVTRQWGPPPTDTVAVKRAVLIRLSDEHREELKCQHEIVDGNFYESGRQLGVLCADGSVQAFDSVDVSSGPRIVSGNERAQQLLGVNSESPILFAVGDTKVFGWNLRSSELKYELSGVFPDGTFFPQLTQWQTRWEGKQDLIFPGEDRPFLYPRSPFDYVRKIAPRGLSNKEREEFLPAL